MAAWVGTAAAAGAPAASSSSPAALHFRVATPEGLNKAASRGAALSAQVLTPQERQFLQTLPEVRVAVPNPPNQPYEVVSPSGEVSGIFPEVLSALATTFGLRLKPVPVQGWAGVLQAVKNRDVDLIMASGVTTERMEYLAFTLGATPVPGAVFARKGDKVDLARARVALERDYFANDWLRRQYPQASIVTVETTEEALAAVGRGQADAYVGGLLAAMDRLSRTPVPGVEVHQ